MPAATLMLEIVTPDGPFLKSEVERVEFPTTSGEIGVLPGHAPLMTEIGVGELRVYRGESMDRHAMAGGFAEITPGSVKIVATFATSEVDEAQIAAAYDKARVALELYDTLPPEVVAADLDLLRMEFAQLARHRRSSRRAR